MTEAQILALSRPDGSAVFVWGIEPVDLFESSDFVLVEAASALKTVAARAVSVAPMGATVSLEESVAQRQRSSLATRWLRWISDTRCRRDC